MIDPKELIIRNHINLNGSHVEVTGVLISMVAVVHYVDGRLDKTENCDPKELSPIPITPELLTINMGFSTRTSGIVGVSCWEKGGFYINQKEDGKFYFTLCGKHVELKYVHTLQNAFSLTGQELEIKEPVTA